MRVFGLLLATVLVAVPATAQALYPTGTVEVTAGPVDCDGEECYDITVRCSNVAAPAKARLKVGGAAEKGTILFTTGGPGTFQYGGVFQSRKILYNTRAAGFRSVQLEWVDSWLIGSPGQEEGHARLACRSATVAQWVYDNLIGEDESKVFCATGHSGGATQVSYMLSHYGLEDILSLIVPTGGPPMGRMDLTCMMGMHGRGLEGLLDQGFGYMTPGSGPCSSHDPKFMETLRLASVASGEGDYVHPQTMVAFISEGIESLRLGYGVAMGMTYHDLLVREGSPLIRNDVVTGVTHAGETGLYNTQKGIDLISDTLINECRPHSS